MRVISFHAYKGGRGRTTAIASIANLCARLGMNVALLDADVTAPWLHTRYDISQEVLESRGWVKSLLDAIAKSPPSVVPDVDLNDHSYFLDLPEQGSIRLFAPGNPDTDEYWTWMVEEFPHFFGIRADPHITESWRILRALIAGATPSPDVLLVDAPAGYHQASAYISIAIADTAVLFAQEDHADADWTTRMVERMRHARPSEAVARYGEMSLIGVRSRYPGYIRADIGADEQFRNFQEPYDDAGFDRWVSLESDPRVELTNRELPIALSGPIHATRLVKGYAELLSVALGSESPDGSALLGELRDGEVIPGERPQFFLLNERGILLNPADETRNVSLRVETFCALLDDLHKELIDLPRRDGDKTPSRAALETAGYDPGRKFGESLRPQYESGHLADEERIRSWCEFDSRVGFGALELTRVEHGGTSGDVLAGTIAVEGNFLAAGRGSGEHSLDLCPLLSGYIEGVLGMLIHSMPSDTEVSHPPESCMRVHPDRLSCEFHFRVPARIAASE